LKNFLDLFDYIFLNIIRNSYIGIFFGERALEIQMDKKEFEIFMQKQLEEIKKYNIEKNTDCPECYENQYVFEWIEKYSDEFSKKWNKKQC
jgi:hypothetical protein